jgi:hypothetical protein
VAAFPKGLHKTGDLEGQNVTVEYHRLEGQYDRLPVLVADLVRRQVARLASIAIGCRRRPSLYAPTPCFRYRNGFLWPQPSGKNRLFSCELKPMDSSQSPSLNDQRRISTTEPPIGVDVKAELSAPPPDAVPHPVPVNPTTLAPSAKSFELMRQLEALAHEVALVSRRDSSDQCIKVQEGSNFSAGLQTVEPSIRVSPRDQFASDRPSISRRTFLTLASFFIAARDQLVSYRLPFGRRTFLALASFFIAARDQLVSYRLPFGRRTSLTLADFFIAALIGVAATFVWQFSTAKSPNDVVVAEKQSGFTPVGQASLPDAPPQPTPVTQIAPAPTAPATSPELVQQLEAVTRDLAVLRRSVDELAAKQEHLAAAQEQLAAKQEQKAQNIAKPQAVKRNIKHKMSSPPRRNAPPEHAAQALSVPRPEPKPKPPLPVPPDRR